ncbi:unnamed protein product [Brugia pahangi]|uniref:HotDog ACOT-type domain-containing protein n=1 Tax=Brugia pahangi TaxID=6280 RepID=A0A0N4TWD3_BRUPA|nr:unnamed protein product [Brugia pahangi]
MPQKSFQERHQQYADERIIPMRRKRMMKGCAILYEKVFEGVFRHSICVYLNLSCKWGIGRILFHYRICFIGQSQSSAKIVINLSQRVVLEGSDQAVTYCVQAVVTFFPLTVSCDYARKISSKADVLQNVSSIKSSVKV